MWLWRCCADLTAPIAVVSLEPGAVVYTALYVDSNPDLSDGRAEASHR